MNKIIRLFIVLAMVFSGVSFASGVNDGKSAGGDFLDYLSLEYAKYGRREAREKDYKDARYFRELSKKAKAGHMIFPAEVSTRQIPTEQLRELINAHEKLNYHLSLGARNTAPYVAAVAQASYEAWLQEAEENMNDGDVDEAKATFYTNLAAMNVPQSTTIIYFPTDSATLTSEARSKLNKMIKAMKASGVTDVALATHASTTASHTYNLRLTKLRANAIQSYLRKNGLKDSDVILRTYGEGDLALPTGDNVENKLNRRAVLTFVNERPAPQGVR